MEIVRAGEADWPLARAVRLRSLEADPSAFASTAQREAGLTEHDWRDRIRGSAWFLAISSQSAEAPVGVVLVRPLEPGSDADFEINAMWVAPELRGQGIGKALLEAALTAAGSAGAADSAGSAAGRTVRLWVTNGNDGALALYTRRGFLPTGRTEPLLSDPQLTIAEYVLAIG